LKYAHSGSENVVGKLSKSYVSKILNPTFNLFLFFENYEFGIMK